MRVLQISSRLDGGGAERVALSLVSSLGWAGVEARGLAFYPPRVPILPALSDTLQRSCQFVTKSPGLDLRLYSRLRTAIAKFKPDIIHTHVSVLKYVWPVAVQLGGIPIVHTIHGLSHQEATPLTRMTNLAAFHAGGAIPVAVAKRVADTVLHTYRLKDCHVVYNGVCFPEVGVLRTQWRMGHGIASSAIVFIYVGSLARPKAPDRVLEAFAKAFGDSAGTELVYAGDGPLLLTLTRRTEQLGLNRRVHFLGHLPDVPDAMAAADVMVHCSDMEGDPLVIKEAMGIGLPVLAAPVGGVAEAIQNGVTGYFYPPADIDALARLMASLAASPSDRRNLGDAARSEFTRRFTVQRMAEDYLTMYRRITS